MVGGRRGRGVARPGPGGIALLASLVLHALFATAVWVSGIGARPPLPPLKVYRVNIVSPPPTEPGPSQPVVADPPKVVKPQAAEPVEPKPEPKPAPRPEPEKTPVVKAPTEAKPKAEPTKTPTGPNPKPGAKVAGEGMNVQIDGEAFPYPEYLSNILVQISRFFRWTGASGLSAEVYFVIRRDGSVEDIRLLRGSGDITFNFEAMAAIEQAGNRQAFGPLPDGFERERLPVAFYFEPAR